MESIDHLFKELTKLQQDKRLPPVHLWQPERAGEIDIRIDRDGKWYHEGGLIKRQPLVNLFSTILRKDEDAYCLVTPAEKLRIDVEDVPFIAQDLDIRGHGLDAELLFTTNAGDYVVANAEHPLRIDQRGQPYLLVRDALEARLTRSVYYRLVEFGLTQQADIDEADATDRLIITSQGAQFDLGALS